MQRKKVKLGYLLRPHRGVLALAFLAVLGEANFHNLITAYLIEHRPSEPSVRGAGKFLPDFLRGYPLRVEVPFVADLAMLERAITEVFCAADASLLEAAEMNALRPELWGAVKMRRIPASVVLHARWRAAEVVRAVEEKRAPEPILLVAMLIWANLHGGFTMGLLLGAAFGLEALVNSADWAERKRTFIAWAKFGVAALLVSLITPYGVCSFLITFQIFGLGDALALSDEWKSPDFQTQPLTELILLVALYLVLAVNLEGQKERLRMWLAQTEEPSSGSRCAPRSRTVG